MNTQTKGLSRRQFLRCTAAMGLLAGLESLVPAYAWQRAGVGASERMDQARDFFDLTIRKKTISFGNRRGTALTVNGTVPGPLLRFREGQTVTLRVNNQLNEDTSIHWHGILLPAAMDGVPGVSFPGIRAKEVFTYQFPVKQSGTYWYHSHSGFQEQLGHYGALIIDPLEPDPFAYDREHVVMLTDWTFEDPHRVISKLKKQSDYYNFQQRTVVDFFRDAGQKGWRNTIADRLEWGGMRMSPTDIADVTGYTYIYLVNGLPPEANWTGTFKPGERVRLRFINGSSMTFFNVRIPGLEMTVVQADGQNVQPVVVDEFQIAVAETYDVIVEPSEDRAYTVFAESMDRSGYARGTLAPREGMSAPVPKLRARPLLTMADMGMVHNDTGHGTTPGMDRHGDGAHGSTHGSARSDSHSSSHGSSAHGDHEAHGGGAMPEMQHGQGHGGHGQGGSGESMMMHGPDHHGPANEMVAMMPRSRLHEPGTGLENAGHRVLVYTDLRGVKPGYDQREPDREIEMHLTGSMERYIWSIDGKKFSEAEPIRLRYGERVRFTLVNDTMMNHPFHLHGMWIVPENGAGPYRPLKHTLNVKPAERLSFDVTADAAGDWAFHCHLLYHMEMGMFRVVSVTQSGEGKAG